MSMRARPNSSGEVTDASASAIGQQTAVTVLREFERTRANLVGRSVVLADGKEAVIVTVMRGLAPFTEAGRVWPRMAALQGGVILQGLSPEGTNTGLHELPLALLFSTLPVAGGSRHLLIIVGLNATMA